jgi:hypothetical protein
MKVITKYAGLAALVIIVASGSLATATTVAKAAQTGHDPDVNGELRPADAWAPANVQLYAPGGVQRYFELGTQEGS